MVITIHIYNRSSDLLRSLPLTMVINVLPSNGSDRLQGSLLLTVVIAAERRVLLKPEVMADRVSAKQW